MIDSITHYEFDCSSVTVSPFLELEVFLLCLKANGLKRNVTYGRRVSRVALERS